MLEVSIVVIVIVIIVALKNKKSEYSTIRPSSKKEDYQIIDFYKLFEHVLDNTHKFIDAYLSECPNEWLFINISPVREKGEFSTDSYRYYEEFIEIKISVGRWYDGILYRSKEIEDYMVTIYEYDRTENTFTYRMRAGSSTNCVIPSEIVRRKLFDYLDIYEKNNPSKKLDRASYGVHHRWNL